MVRGHELGSPRLAEGQQHSQREGHLGPLEGRTGDARAPLRAHPCHADAAREIMEDAELAGQGQVAWDSTLEELLTRKDQVGDAQ